MEILENLSNILESILFVSGNPVPIDIIAEKLGVGEKDVRDAAKKLQERYAEKGGLRLLIFNKKLQLSSNPEYKDYVSSVLNPIKEREFTRTILECSAIIAYKQPITKGELEALRGLNCDYAIHTLLDLKMIEPVGRKDAVGRPILYATTDNFLKRFKLNSIEDLPDYDELMESIAKLHADEPDSYLYANNVTCMRTMSMSTAKRVRRGADRLRNQALRRSAFPGKRVPARMKQGKIFRTFCRIWMRMKS